VILARRSAREGSKHAYYRRIYSKTHISHHECSKGGMIVRLEDGTRPEKKRDGVENEYRQYIKTGRGGGEGKAGHSFGVLTEEDKETDRSRRNLNQ